MQETSTLMPMSSKNQDGPTSAAAKKPLKKLVAEKAGSLHPQDTVATAGERMREHDAEEWPVTEDLKLVGMVKEKNPDWKIGGHGHDPESFHVGQIMDKDLIYCHEDEDCTKALQIMEERKLTILPVVDQQLKVVGMITVEELRNRLSPLKSNSTDPTPEVNKRAAELAQKDGRTGFTESDLLQARAEVLGPKGSEL